MAARPNKRFDQFLVNFSDVYPKDRILELRFLLYDHLPLGTLADENRTSHLLNELRNRGHIAYNNVDLLCIIAQIMKNIHVMKCVDEYFQLICMEMSSISRPIGDPRLKLYTAMLEITENEGGDLDTLIAFYDLGHRKFKNKWDVVFYLENEFLLITKTFSMWTFASQLNNRAKSILLDGQFWKPEYTPASDDERLEHFLIEFSNAYRGIELLELRFLLHDNISIDVLARECYGGMKLLRTLTNTGVITYGNVDLLSEIADVTGNVSAKASVNKYKEQIGAQYDACCEKFLSSYRKHLFRAMVLINESDLLRLIEFYNLGSQQFENKWDLVFHLEYTSMLQNTKGTLKKFADQLSVGASIILLGPEADNEVVVYGPATDNKIRAPPTTLTAETSARGAGSLSTNRPTIATETLPPPSTPLSTPSCDHPTKRPQLAPLKTDTGATGGGGAKWPSPTTTMPITETTRDHPTKVVTSVTPLTELNHVILRKDNIDIVHYSKGLSEEIFRELLTALSGWLKDGRHTFMLKFLLADFDKINVVDIQKAQDSFDLFKLLITAGRISATNIDLITEAFSLCGWYGAENVIQQWIPSFQGFGDIEIKGFSQVRQNLIEFGGMLDHDKIKQMCDWYEMNVNQIEDQWDLLFQLDTKHVFKDIGEFICKLERNKMKVEANVVKKGLQKYVNAV